MFNLSVKQSFWLNLIIFIACSAFAVNNTLAVLIGYGGFLTLFSIGLNVAFAYLSFQSLKAHYTRRMYPFDRGILKRSTPWREGKGKRW